MPCSLLRVASCFRFVLYSSRSALSYLRVSADRLARFADLPTRSHPRSPAAASTRRARSDRRPPAPLEPPHAWPASASARRRRPRLAHSHSGPLQPARKPLLPLPRPPSASERRLARRQRHPRLRRSHSARLSLRRRQPEGSASARRRPPAHRRRSASARRLRRQRQRQAASRSGSRCVARSLG